MPMQYVELSLGCEVSCDQPLLSSSLTPPLLLPSPIHPYR